MSQDLILFLAANPGNTSRLDLDRECAAIENELRMTNNRDLEFQARWVVTVDELMRHLNALQPTVLHFSGHGASGGLTPYSDPTFCRDAGTARGDDGGIYLEDDRGGSQLVTAHALARMIQTAATSVRLVVLNACYSEAQADVICRAVDCVVGMNGLIEDVAARAFAVGFYRALGYRCSVANAVEQAAATLAARQLAGAPCCRTREGIDASRVLASGLAMSGQPWAERFDAVIRLAREAHERLATDPLSSAARAQQVIEHIVDYVHERELGPADARATLDARLKRVEAKLVIPRMVASHVSSVAMHTRSVIHVSGGMMSPRPGLLQPCLGSLAVVVEWFFREYLKQPAPELGWYTSKRHHADRRRVPDATPVNSTIGTVAILSTHCRTGIGELIPVWRTTPMASALRIEAGEDDGPHAGEVKFVIEDVGKTYYVGRTQQRRDGTRNDFALPETWNSISRDQATLATHDCDVHVRNTSSKDNMFVHGEAVAQGRAHVLRHGDIVQLGRCYGTFVDRRYYAATPAGAIDRRTGLLSRQGLVAEIASALASRARRVLLVIRCPEDTMPAAEPPGVIDPDRKAVSVAAALHRQDPSRPIARIEQDVAMLLESDDSIQEMAAIANRVARERCVSGYVTLDGKADQALPRLAACLGALSRIVIAGREPISPADLTRYALVPTPLEAFAEHVRPLFGFGGGALLFVLGDLDHLEKLAPRALAVLELELVEMLGARMGPRDVVSFAGPGLVVFGTSGDVERLAQEKTVAWHARGSVTAGAFEIDRSLCTHLLALSDLENLAEHAAALARGEIAALGASGLPAPLALGALAVDEARDPIERAGALVRLAEVAWQMLAFILAASARAVGGAGASHDERLASGPWPMPWRSLARAAARILEGQPLRIQQLASVARSPDHDDAFRSSMRDIAAVAELMTAKAPDRTSVEHSLPRLENAVRKLFAALVPLRGWTLVAIESSEFVDVDATTQRVEYVDYTGPSARGSHQRGTVTGFRGLGRFVYLVRWEEGLAIALEPFIRRVPSPASGDDNLFLANTLISEPGCHRYRSMSGKDEIELPVTARQLGISAVRRDIDGVAQG